MEERELLIKKLYNYVISKGKKTSKPDILNSDDKVYTKKVSVDLKVEGANVKYISVTGYNADMKDTNSNDLRINIQNFNKRFHNLFVSSISDNLLKKIAEKLNLK